jgi:hypothetical protein
MLRTPFVYLIADSRANNFDAKKLYAQPEDFKVKFCIKRGATVASLCSEFLSKLDTAKLCARFPIIIKIGCGINDFTEFITNKHGEKELKYSGKTRKEIFEDLLEFKQAIKNKCPSALVGFITEAPLSSKIYHDYCKSSGALKFPTQIEETLNPFQTKIDTELDALNSLLKFENCNKQKGHTKGCMTVSWHNSVCRHSKRKNKSGKFRVVVKNDFRQLCMTVYMQLLI